MLTACGRKVESTSNDTSVTEVEVQKTEAEPTVEPTEKETEATEKETETIETVEVELATTTAVEAEDFLSKNGLEISPQGNMKMLLTPSSQPDTDEVEEMDAVVSVSTTESAEEGYSDTTVTYEITMNTALSYALDAFDRYTGISFTTGKQSFETNETATKHEDVCVFDVDGTQYDCGLTASQEVNGEITTLTVSVHHPSAYDGTVFCIGRYGLIEAQEYAEADIDDSKPTPIIPNPNYYFFTVSNE